MPPTDMLFCSYSSSFLGIEPKGGNLGREKSNHWAGLSQQRDQVSALQGKEIICLSESVGSKAARQFRKSENLSQAHHPFMTLWVLVISCGPPTHHPSSIKGLRGSVSGGEEPGCWGLVRIPAVPLTSRIIKACCVTTLHLNFCWE